MTSLNIAIIADPFHTLNQETDSTCAIIRSALMRKHHISFINADDILYERNNTYGICSQIVDKKTQLEEGTKEKKRLDTFDVILWRKDPPFNMSYINTTYLLEMIKEKVWIMNAPDMTRNFNEKLGTLHFGKYMPETVITKNETEILQFLKKQKNGIVIKPLDQKGGQGTYFLAQKDWNKKEIIRTSTENGTAFIMAQTFLKGVRTKGDRRHLIIGGKLWNSIARIPEKENFRGNICAGATAIATKATKSEQKICSEIGSFLSAKGVDFVGLDMIDGYVTEINITSPILGQNIYPENAKNLIEFIEHHE